MVSISPILAGATSLLSPNGAIQAAADSTEREEILEVEDPDDDEHEEEMLETDDEATEIDNDGRCRKRKRRILFSKSQTYELERRYDKMMNAV